MTAKTILVPTDFSDCAKDALDYAITLAVSLGARVYLMSSVRVPTAGLAELGVVMTDGALESMLRSTHAELDKLASRRTAMIIETIVRAGDARDMINEIANELRADLIVMGTHGRRGIRRLLLGSVAEEIVRTALCPVLTIRHFGGPSA